MKLSKNLFATLVCVALCATLFVSCDNDDPTPEPEPQGVLINGVRWATSNVDAPGTFAATPESRGMLFQWGSRRAWNTTDPEISGDWPFSPSGTTWVREDDPCPPGWRIPTEDQLRSLYDAGSIWTTRYGVYGRLFGTAPHQIFLPAAGRRLGLFGGSLSFVHRAGHYWSNTQISSTSAMGLRFDSGETSVTNAGRRDANSIRCVAE